MASSIEQEIRDDWAADEESVSSDKGHSMANWGSPPSRATSDAEPLRLISGSCLLKEAHFSSPSARSRCAVSGVFGSRLRTDDIDVRPQTFRSAVGHRSAGGSCLSWHLFGLERKGLLHMPSFNCGRPESFLHRMEVHQRMAIVSHMERVRREGVLPTRFNVKIQSASGGMQESLGPFVTDASLSFRRTGV